MPVSLRVGALIAGPIMAKINGNEIRPGMVIEFPESASVNAMQRCW